MRKFLTLGLIGLVFTACNSEGSQNESQECVYSYSDSQTILEWTAFKFTDKTPVKGTFNDVTITTISNATSVDELIASIGFSIPVASVETQDETKNSNIFNGFFKFMGPDVIVGNVVSVKANELTFEVSLNGVKEKVTGNYEVSGTLFSFKGTMNLTLFGANKAMASLNNQCGDNHKGPDGVTTMSDKVELSFTTQLVKTCK